MAVGQVYYTGWCDEDGKLLDDGTVSRLGRQLFRMTSADPSLRWLAMNAVGMDVKITRSDRPDRGAEPAGTQVARDAQPLLQGARSMSSNISALTQNSIGNMPVSVSRTGYTGDLGYEIWMDAEHALPVWDALMEAGDDYGITPCGILAMDMARVEAGLFMIDVDYTASNHAWIEGQKSSPFEMGLDWAVNLDKKGYFVGRRALEREKRDGSAWKLVGLEIEWEGLGAALRRSRPAAANPGDGRARQPAGDASTASRSATPRPAPGRRC